ncbi:MAG: hypothetical protein U0V03_05095 [Bacteroidia bacterium]|jgi:hypothetical protein
MKSQNLSVIIKIQLLFLAIQTCGYSQSQKMERLILQYNYTQVISDSVKENINLQIIDKYLSEGDYDRAVSLINKINDSGKNKDLKLLLSGKAEFLIDNYQQSLNYLNSVDEKKLSGFYFKELQLFKILNYNHLMYIDSAYFKLTSLFVDAGKDTTGFYNKMKELSDSKLYNLRKAKRRAVLFPGAGLWYVGEKKRAFTSALISFSFLGYTAYSVYTKHYITALLTGTSQFLRFYNGGKRAALKIGAQKNKKAYINYILPLNEFIECKILEL